MTRLLTLILLGWCFLGSTAPAAARGTAEVLFTPWDDAEGAILRALDAARKTVHVQAYLITSRAIAGGLAATHRRGVQVAVLADHEMAQKSASSQLASLVSAGIDVRLETRYAAAHNKVILIDAALPNPVVITGSYNFSWSAQARNAENLLILRDDPHLARRYLDNWRRHEADAQPWQ